MGELTPSGGRRMSRKQRESRAFNLLVGSGVLGVGAVVMLFVSGFGAFLLLAILAAACAFGFKRSVS